MKKWRCEEGTGSRRTAAGGGRQSLFVLICLLICLQAEVMDLIMSGAEGMDPREKRLK